ncbi:MAG TPA: carbonic anhydrase [Candidatus Angelobacter sp.]|nr:carbonic anhydrase [Candidatus Angelobacter sp.]
MRKVMHFSSPRDQYTCDAAVVWCYDNRFEVVFRKLLKRIGVVYADPIRIAGGAKCLAAPKHDSEREFVVEQIRISMRLHNTRTVVLMLHSDCGAYGGLSAFNNDPANEAENHAADLKRAATLLQSAIPGLAVKAFYVDFEGAWEIEIAGSVEIAV